MVLFNQLKPIFMKLSLTHLWQSYFVASVHVAKALVVFCMRMILLTFSVIYYAQVSSTRDNAVNTNPKNFTDIPFLTGAQQAQVVTAKIPYSETTVFTSEVTSFRTNFSHLSHLNSYFLFRITFIY